MNIKGHIEQRMGFFVGTGQLDKVPSAWQVKVGTKAMLPISLSESARERERSRTTWLGQIPFRVPLQVLYSPSQIRADSAMTKRPIQLVRHLLSVYHEDAFLGYDLQLLQSHPGGLELLQEKAEKIVRGRDPLAPILRKLVSWPGYHEGLIQLAENARNSKYPDPLDLDQRFATLVGFAQFCCTLPDWPPVRFYGFDLQRIKGREEGP